LNRLSYRAQGVLLVAVIALGVGFISRNMKPQEVTVTVEAPAGTRISGSYEVDGVRSAIDAEAPTSFTLTGRHLEFLIENDSTQGEISVVLSASESGMARTTAGPGSAVQCGYKKGKFPGSSSTWAREVTARSQ
jgi:hypothetical protein